MTDAAKISLNYRKRDFWIDLFASIPMGVVRLIALNSSDCSAAIATVCRSRA